MTNHDTPNHEAPREDGGAGHSPAAAALCVAIGAGIALLVSLGQLG